MRMLLHACVCVHVFAYMCVFCVHVFACDVCVHIFACECLLLHVFVCLQVIAYACACVFVMCIHVHECQHVCGTARMCFQHTYACVCTLV